MTRSFASRRWPGATSWSDFGRREKLGKTGPDAEAYAKAVVMADFEEAGDHDVFKKLRRDFDEAKVEESDHRIRRAMDELMAQAVAEIQAGK